MPVFAMDHKPCFDYRKAHALVRVNLYIRDLKILCFKNLDCLFVVFNPEIWVERASLQSVPSVLVCACRCNLLAIACMCVGLQEQLARTQVALEQWKSNDSVQLESARHDVIRLRGQLEAQVESAKVASAQCKSAQSELKTLRQQIESRNQSSLSGQSELAWKGLLESAKQESATQLESVSRELKAQTELTRNTQAELSSVRHQLHCTKSELASVCEQHRSQTESSKTQQEQMQQRGHEQKSQAVWQAEQLKGSETELQEARRECQHLKVACRT